MKRVILIMNLKNITATTQRTQRIQDAVSRKVAKRQSARRKKVTSYKYKVIRRLIINTKGTKIYTENTKNNKYRRRYHTGIRM